MASELDDPLALCRTIEARIELDPDLAQTWVRSPRESLPGRRAPSERGLAAVDALRALTASGGAIDGRLTIQGTLGEGGMGIVRLATQATLGRSVAVKTRRPGLETDEADATLRVLREAWVTGALEHPNVVPVYDVGVDASGAPFILMKRIEGSSWADLLRAPAEVERRFGVHDPLEWHLRILMTVCEAVHFAHSRGILHRDLKPENVMIGSFGEVYVLDWGIAVSLRADPSGRLPSVAEATDLVGTPAYMAPEMVIADPAQLSERTDVYLLGSILFEIFAGTPPHDGPSLNAMITRVLLSAPPFSDAFPDDARTICARAMSRTPKDRFEDAAALRRALDDYLRHRTSRRIASDAKQSLDRMIVAIDTETPGEERTLRVVNLLGECRFGYRAALSAWPENESARRGLDQALLAVIELELREGDPSAAATLLREVSAAPAEVATRVEVARAARVAEEERLRKLEADGDPRIGSRTRAVISAVFGSLWVTLPLGGWVFELRGHGMLTSDALVTASTGFLALSLAAVVWARETLSKTLFNRRVMSTLVFYLLAQVVLALGLRSAGVAPPLMLALLVFSWGLIETMLAVWVERWFALPAACSTIAFGIIVVWPSAALPLLSLVSLILGFVIQLVWFPRQDLERIRVRREELRRQARDWLAGPR